MKCLNCDSKKLIYVNDNEIIDSYKCLNCGHIFPKQYFFISHSHLDIEKVRVIRNTIEETFFYEPILFFLKSLSEETEIKDLLKREIDERVWFVYCNSENAVKSKYVQYERSYVNKLVEAGITKNLINIELDQFNIWDDECINYLRKQINHHIKKTKLFFSSSRRLDKYIKPTISELKKLGYSIFEDTSLNPGDNWLDAISNQIRLSSYNDGVFIQVIYGEPSSFSDVELDIARENGAYVLRIIISDENKNNTKDYIYINSKYLDDTNYLVNAINSYLKTM